MHKKNVAIQQTLTAVTLLFAATNALSFCKYGGAPTANGTQACTCYSAPTCTGGSQSGTNFCTYGGTATGGGDQSCTCNNAPICNGSTQSGDNYCTYGGSASAGGGHGCSCWGAPTCTGSSQTGSNYCTYGGTAAGGGSNGCSCYGAPNIASLCSCGGTASADGTQGYTCNQCSTSLTVTPAYSKHSGASSSGKKMYGYASIAFYYDSASTPPVGSVSTTDLGNGTTLLAILRTSDGGSSWIATSVPLSYLKLSVGGTLCFEASSPAQETSDRLYNGYFYLVGGTSSTPAGAVNGGCTFGTTSAYAVEITARP